MATGDALGAGHGPRLQTRASEGTGLDKMGCLAFVGLMLVHTVVGAVLGVPILIACMLVFFVRAIRRHRAKTVSGMCPGCQADIAIDGAPADFDCHQCGRTLCLADGAFQLAEGPVGV